MASILPGDPLSKDMVLTIKDIAPRWAGRIDHMPLSRFSFKGTGWGVQMLFAETCIVGEAYGYSAPYIESCSTCREIGYEFVASYARRSQGRFQRNLDTFVEHWNASHALVTMRKRQSRRGVGRLVAALLSVTTP